ALLRWPSATEERRFAPLLDSLAPPSLPQPQESPFVDFDAASVGNDERRRRVLDDRRARDLVAGLEHLHLPERRRQPASLLVHVARALARLVRRLGLAERVS